MSLSKIVAEIEKSMKDEIPSSVGVGNHYFAGKYFSFFKKMHFDLR
jgi:hypothetical protein